ncbi:MAG TPA: helix-turn-helix transcriptional regulator [bacterium]|nr:helix-turn-helix transcriptional regulator [bacterium]HPP86378.1 helix-turn-helix transcriptional regulator [bacterium]
MSIGLKIKALRFSQDLSEMQLAEIIGVSEEKIKFWEKDLNRPTNAVLSKIADYFKIDIDYFFEEEPRKKIDEPLAPSASDKKQQSKELPKNKSENVIIAPQDKIENFKSQITAKKKEELIEKKENKTEPKKETKVSEELIELRNLNSKLDEIINILKNKPDLSKIKKIETTYNLENANKLLKEGWILLELFKDEKGFLGYRLGSTY